MGHARVAATPDDCTPLLRIARDLVPKAVADEALETLKALVAASLGDAHAAAEDLDALVDALRARDRARLGAVYEAFRETCAFQAVVAAPQLRAAAAAMVGTDHLHAPFQHAVFRMDLAGEHWRGFGWHQDYPYNMLSDRSVTAWTPLTHSGPWNGSVEVAPTLSDRVHPVEIDFKRDAHGRRLSTRDAFIAARLQPAFDAAAETLTLAPGDVVLFHNRLVHRSGYNPGPRHRYSIQARFGALLAPEMTARGWANRRVDGFDTFKALHPELVEHEEF